MNILIVDDNPANLKLLRAQLECEGHAVSEAADGVEALRVLEREPMDAVISDILMPNMDGYRLCHEVRRSQRCRALAFILYTSTYTSSGDRDLAATVSADKYLIKPCPVAELLRALGEAVELSRDRTAKVTGEPDTLFVMQQYSSTLVQKLEEKNAELQAAVKQLEQAQARIQLINTDLERRVGERTAELDARNQELTAALASVRELNALLPMCSYCRKIRDDKDYWLSVESYISQHTRSHFSHGICPECFEKFVRPELEQLAVCDKGIPGGQETNA